jgi:hypothetical protein
MIEFDYLRHVRESQGVSRPGRLQYVFMQERPELPHRLGPPDDPTTGWFAYLPDGSRPENLPGEDPEVDYVELRCDEYAGPFWEHRGHLSDDFDELHRWLGISRELYDDAMAWNSRGGDWAEQQRLLRRLREKLPDRIEVPPARERPPREVFLLQLRVAGAAGQRQLSEKRRPGRDEPEPLPLTEQDLVDEVAVWLDRRRSFIRGTDENAAAHHAWEDKATDLCRRLGAAWGPDYAVRII